MQEDIFVPQEEKSIPIEIRYEGGHADHGSMPMESLAESIEGFGRIYAVVGHFVSTGEYALQLQVLNASVIVTAQDRKCFSVSGMLSWANSSGLFSGLLGAVFTTVVAVVYSRNRGGQEEMKHLHDLLKQKLEYDDKTTQRLLDTVDKLAAALQPSARKSLAPIGGACDRIDLYSHGKKEHALDIFDKESLSISAEETISGEKNYTIVISELDKLKRTCRACFSSDAANEAGEDDPSARILCEITDPAAMITPNPYMSAFASGSPLAVKAKALIKNGVISKLYISDAL